VTSTGEPLSRERKGQSPFYPGQPVPPQFFVGRTDILPKIQRAASQVAGGKPQAVFISGDYGIGKSSLARYSRVLLDEEVGVLGFHVMLGTARSIDDVATAVVQKALETEAGKERASEAIRNGLAKYVGEQSLFGVTIRLDALRADAPDISRGFLPFLRSLYARIKDDYKGLLLILDEINGLAGDPTFGAFLKSLVDDNAVSDDPLPLLLILCGTEGRRLDLIKNHEPVERIFELVRVEPLSFWETQEFFERTFGTVGLTLTPTALGLLAHFSGGLPKLMHIIGDTTFWMATEAVIDEEMALSAVFEAAEEVGRKFIDQQVLAAIRSKQYRSILAAVAGRQFSLEFSRADVIEGLSESEGRNLDNFLRRLRKLHVIEHGENRGEYRFTDRLTRLYLQLYVVRSNPSAAHRISEAHKSLPAGETEGDGQGG